MRRASVWVVLSALVLTAFTVLGASASAATFTSALVGKQEFSAEPSIAVDTTSLPSRGWIYYIGPGASKLFVSKDTGASWVGGAAVSDFGDADVAVDAQGTVFTSALLDDNTGTNTVVPVDVVAAGGATIIRQRNLNPSATGITCDRQWTEAWGNGNVVTTARCGSTDQVWRSSDGWQTMQGPTTIDTGIGVAGPIVYAGGALYQGYTKSGIWVAKSTDGGATWNKTKVTSDSSTMHWPVVAMDDAGALYVTYSISTSNADGSGGGYMVFLYSSTDGGATWVGRTPVSSQIASPVAGNTPSAIFPWITAGAAGRVAVSWFQARDSFASETDVTPDTGLPTTSWDVIVARSDNATAAAPTWDLTTAVSGFHTGSECTFGLLCLGPQQTGLVNAPTPFDRRDLDFFETAVAPGVNGALYIAYPQDRPQIGTNPLDYLFSWVDLRLARQTGGTTLR